jgi:hypothetical protein
MPDLHKPMEVRRRLVALGVPPIHMPREERLQHGTPPRGRRIPTLMVERHLPGMHLRGPLILMLRAAGHQPGMFQGHPTHTGAQGRLVIRLECQAGGVPLLGGMQFGVTPRLRDLQVLLETMAVLRRNGVRMLQVGSVEIFFSLPV